MAWELVNTQMTGIRSLRAQYGRCRYSGYKQAGLNRLREAAAICKDNPAKGSRLIKDAYDILERAKNISDDELLIQAQIAKLRESEQ